VLILSSLITCAYFSYLLISDFCICYRRSFKPTHKCSQQPVTSRALFLPRQHLSQPAPQYIMGAITDPCYEKNAGSAQQWHDLEILLSSITYTTSLLLGYLVVFIIALKAAHAKISPCYLSYHLFCFVAINLLCFHLAAIPLVHPLNAFQWVQLKSNISMICSPYWLLEEIIRISLQSL
jgi:hypothetical protein